MLRFGSDSWSYKRYPSAVKFMASPTFRIKSDCLSLPVNIFLICFSHWAITQLIRILYDYNDKDLNFTSERSLHLFFNKDTNMFPCVIVIFTLPKRNSVPSCIASQYVNSSWPKGLIKPFSATKINSSLILVS